MSNLTKEMIHSIVKTMREHPIPLRIIETKKEARRLTKGDPMGRIWKVGDGYYYLSDFWKPGKLKDE